MPAVTVLTVISVVTSLSSPGKEGKGDQNNRSSELITVIPLAGVWGATPPDGLDFPVELLQVHLANLSPYQKGLLSARFNSVCC